ncbi:uncharacterized protein LOC125680779 [Ostrea edulis]|uniref:uncharacterized protein LOC125680779 n=1 Tax=Ostrea edulis TaxID=37623 RepID=UPI0024AFAE60|nr:uncharacterized protein LOC125680779 [Ostrea edulis]
MRTALLFLGLLAVAAARSLEKRDDEENHWGSAFLTKSENGYSDDKKNSIAYGIANDLEYFLAVVKKIENEPDKSIILQMMSGAVELMKLHESEAEKTDKLIEPKTFPIPEKCTKDAVTALKECGPMVGRVVSCIQTGTQEIVKYLKSDIAAFEDKIGTLKGFISIVAGEINDIKGLFEHCSKRDPIQHWKDAWRFTKTDLQDSKKIGRLMQLGNKIKGDLMEMRKNLAALLDGSGGDVETALGHLDYAVQLAELDEKKDAASITPAVVPVEFECSRDEVLALDGCEGRAVRIGTCIKNMVDEVLKKFEQSPESVDDLIKIAKFTKGSVLNIAKADDVVHEVIDDCKKEHGTDEKKRELLSLLRRVLNQEE